MKDRLTQIQMRQVEYISGRVLDLCESHATQDTTSRQDVDGDYDMATASIGFKRGDVIYKVEVTAWRDPAS